MTGGVRAALAAVALGLPLAACGGARSGPGAAAPSAHAACAPSAPVGVLLAGTSPARVAELVARTREGIVIVADACGEPRVLPACHAKGSYATIGVTPSEHRVTLATAEELSINAPRSDGGPALAAPLALDVAVTGRRVASRAAVAREDLEGSCAGATHFVRAIDLGVAARADPASKPPDAPPASCAVENDDVGAPGAPALGCDAPVRVHLAPIGAARDDDLERGEPAISCAPGTVLSEDRCAPPGRARPYACSPGDVAECTAQCEHGDEPSCAMLGWMLLTGHGADADPAHGFDLSTRACVGQVGRACGNAAAALAGAAEDDDDVRHMLVLYKTGCDLGDGWSCVELGRAVARSGGADLGVLRALYARGCDAGEPTSCAELGFTFARGGPAPDAGRERAAHERGCEGGEMTSCANLGVLYLRGDGVAADATRARALFRRACDGGLPLGCSDLGLLYQSGEGGEQDYAKAAELLGGACEQKDALGCRLLGLMREKALGAPRDVAFAAGLYAKACDLKDALACNELGRLHLDGVGIVKDEARAAALFQQACDAGIAMSCHNLALVYEEGRGVAPDADKAGALYRRACDAGYEPSCRHVGPRAK